MRTSIRPLSCAFILRPLSARRHLWPDFTLEIGPTQACDLVKSGAPKGIRILKVLVTIGTRWDSLVQQSCGESQ